MTTAARHVDALVIGAGAGGLLAAARLSHQGYRTLVVERLDRVGGRASSEDIDGFTVNNGAIVIEVGGITEETFTEVGARFDVRRPQPPLLYRIGGKDVDVTGGGWGFLLSKLTRQGAKLLDGLGAARTDEGLPEDELSTADWIRRYTSNENVHGVFPREFLPPLLPPPQRVQEVRLLPRGHHRRVARARRRRRRVRRRGLARQ